MLLLGTERFALIAFIAIFYFFNPKYTSDVFNILLTQLQTT